jgi:hypothetical protein
MMAGMSWGRQTRDDGLVTAMVGPTTVSRLASVFDPSAPWILLTDFRPGLKGWQQVRVPLLSRQLMDPVPATVRMLGFEVLLSTEQFLALAPELDDGGLLARQFTKRPDDRVQFPHARVPANRYRAFGLVVGIDLPHAHEVAQVVATSDERLDRALNAFTEATNEF